MSWFSDDRAQEMLTKLHSYITTHFVRKIDYATPSSVGVVKVDNSTVTVDADGTLHASGESGASALTDLTDVNITSAQNGESLVYDSTSSKWVNSVPFKYEITDTEPTTIEEGKIVFVYE